MRKDLVGNNIFHYNYIIKEQSLVLQHPLLDLDSSKYKEGKRGCASVDMEDIELDVMPKGKDLSTKQDIYSLEENIVSKQKVFLNNKLFLNKLAIL